MFEVGTRPEWPALHVERVSNPLLRGNRPSVRADAGDRVLTVRGERATMEADRGRLLLDRSTITATVVAPEVLPPDELVHPYLTSAAAVFARWRGGETFHAGAFVADGGAWVLAGDSEAGKSTLLGLLALGGHPILTDDLLVLAGTTCLPGPRCVDLRPLAAARIGAVGGTTRSRSGLRRRLPLEPGPGEVALAGWIYLRWGPELRSERVPPSERLRRVTQYRSVPGIASDPQALLDLAARPAWELERPRRWDLLPRVHERLLAMITG